MLSETLKQHYLSSGVFTDAGLYASYFRSLPSEPKALGDLISHQIIHRVTLAQGNAGANADLRYGDLSHIPWHRPPCDGHTRRPVPHRPPRVCSRPRGGGQAGAYLPVCGSAHRLHL